MKKLIVSIIILVITTTISFAQTEKVANTNIEKTEISETIKTAEAASFKIKAKVKRLNHKKSNEIISIKAYRKSLQIKTKSKRLC